MSLDGTGYREKPGKKEVSAISKQIAQKQKEVELQHLADLVGNKGHTFCPSIFSDGKRKAENFVQMQLFGLDFDNGGSIREIRQRAEEYFLPIAFVYHTFHSTKEHPRFRAVFVNDVPVEDKRVAEIMIAMLLEIFPQADKSCKDVPRMFFGGKGLDGEVCGEAINIVTLAEGFQRVLFEKGGEHYNRDLSQFAKKHNIACINNCLQIECVHSNGTENEFFGGKTASDQYIYGSETIFPPNFPRYVLHNGYQPNVRKNYREEPPVRVAQGEIEKRCNLYHEFVKGSDMHHNLKFLLLTNLIHIKGGGKKFHSIMGKRKEPNKKKWRFYAFYAKARGYKPQCCDTFCPYVDSCRHKANMVLTVREQEKIRKINQNEDYQPVEAVYQHIEQCLEKFLRDGSFRISLIPTQTAIGKTEAYCNLIREHPDISFVIVVPTNRLKHEVKNRLEGKGIEVMVTPSLDEMNFPEDLKWEIQGYYQQGLGEEVKNLLKNYIKKNKGSDLPDVVNAVYQCKGYLDRLKRIREHHVLVTTHARLATFSRDMIEKDWVIIDEDILSTFFRNMRAVSVSAAKKALGSEHCPGLLKERLKEALLAPEGEYHRMEGEPCPCLGRLSREALEELGIYEDVNDLAIASVCCREGENICYFYPQTLPEGRYAVLSATADLSLYKKYFRDRRIEEFFCYQAKYVGKLKQLTAYSMSRQCIHDHKEELTAYIKKFPEGYQTITFLKYEEEFQGSGIHFGNAEGIDSLKGQNLIILGTPHMSEPVYKLVGCYLGMEVNQEVLAVRRVQANGYEFSFMTYKGQELRELQMYFIRKDLEQCIGRARLLRNRCEVWVLSNFPCEQAELIQEDYLGEGACGPVMAGK